MSMRTYIKRVLAAAFLASAAYSSIHAVGPGEVRWNNEASDTTRITGILIEASALKSPSPNELVSFIGQKFIATPYAAGTLEGTPETLTVNLDSMDCTTFMETVAAMALTIEESRNSWQDFLYNLERIRYRQGRTDGYASRLHYISDWIVDNTHRGTIQEVTDRLKGSAYQVKTLDYMTSHRNAYPALADSAEYARMKSVETGYRSHRFPYIKSAALMSNGAKDILRDGDIIAFTTKTDGLDVSHIGIILMDNGTPRLLHASSKAGKVIVDPRPLSEYLQKNRSITGGRIIRLARL